MPNPTPTVLARRVLCDRDPAYTLDAVLGALDEMRALPGDVITLAVRRAGTPAKRVEMQRWLRGTDPEAWADALHGGERQRRQAEQRERY